MKEGDLLAFISSELMFERTLIEENFLTDNINPTHPYRKNMPVLPLQQ
jgi:hypothetical protein